MYGQALSYNVESKCSQGNEQQKKRHKRQIYSEMATDLQHLNSPGAFSAARPGNQKPQRDSAFKMTPQFPFLLLCGCGTSLRSWWPGFYPFSTSHPTATCPSSSQGLWHVTEMEITLRTLSGPKPGAFHPFPCNHTAIAVPRSIAPLQILLYSCAKICGPQHPLTHYGTVVRRAGAGGGWAKHEGRAAFCLPERERGNRSGKQSWRSKRRGMRTRWFMCVCTWENEKQRFNLVIGLGFLLIINWNSKL